jgi:hypothetical protein
MGIACAAFSFCRGKIMLIKYERPSGTTIEITDSPDNRAYAESLGWVEAKKAAKPKKKAGAK